MATFLMPTPRARSFTDAGVPAASYLLYTYAAGTTTPKAAFTDAAGLVPHPNPIVLDAKGEAVIYYDGNYKLELKTPLGVTVTGYPVDNFQTPLMIGSLLASGTSAQIGHPGGTVASKLAELVAVDAALSNSITANASSQGAVNSLLNTSINAVRSQITGHNIAPIVVDMHFGTLCGRGWLGNAVEIGTYEVVPTTAVLTKSPMDTNIDVVNPGMFREKQLICYKGTDNTWHSAIVTTISGTRLTLDRQLPVGITAGAEVVYFYANDAHPNPYGYKCIADDALRQIVHKEAVAYTGPNYELWSAVGAATVAGLPLSASGVDSYAIPGTTTNANRAAKVDVLDLNQGAKSEYVSLEGGGYRAHIVLNGGQRVGGFSAALSIEIQELRADGIEYTIAVASANGNVGLRAVDVDFSVSPGSAVRVRILSINGGPATFSIGPLRFFRRIERLASINNGTHVLFGDSWYASGFFMSRLQERLPAATFINKGVAGHRASHLLARFDADVRPLTQNYTWLMCGTNDYYSDIPPALFEQQMTQIASQIASIDSQAIIFNASVGDVTYAVAPFERLTVSREYANRVNYHSATMTPDGFGSRQRSANISISAQVIPALSTVVLGAVPGQTTLPAALRYLYTNTAGMTINIGYAGIIDGTALVNPQAIASGTIQKNVPLPRTDTQARFVVLTVTNPSGSPIALSMVADILWVQT